MRILHTSDWHLGKVLMERSLLPDQRHALRQITDLLQREPHDLLIVAGDVFDRSIPPEDAVTLLGQWLHEVREVAPRLPIVIIAGNHDSGARLAWSAGLLDGAGVHIRGEAAAIERPVPVTTREGEVAEVWAVPFLWPGDLAQEGEGPTTQVTAFAHAMTGIRKRYTPGSVQILAAHCFTQGGRTSRSERTLIGQATLIDPGVFAGFDYVALGHLHRPQAVTRHAHYSGSLARYSFSEVEDVKGVLSVDVQAGREPTVAHVPLVPLREMRVLAGTLDDLLTSPVFEPFRDDYLSITLTQAVHAGQPMAMLRTRFPHLLQLGTADDAAAEQDRPARDRQGDRLDPEVDFLDFQRHLRTSDVDAEVVDAFRSLRLAAGGAS